MNGKLISSIVYRFWPEFGTTRQFFFVFDDMMAHKNNFPFFPCLAGLRIISYYCSAFTVVFVTELKILVIIKRFYHPAKCLFL